MCDELRADLVCEFDKDFDTALGQLKVFYPDFQVLIRIKLSLLAELWNRRLGETKSL